VPLRQPLWVSTESEGSYQEIHVKLHVNGFDLSKPRLEWLVNGQVIYYPCARSISGTDAEKGNEVSGSRVRTGPEVLFRYRADRECSPEITQGQASPRIFKPGDTLNVRLPETT